MKTTFNYKL